MIKVHDTTYNFIMQLRLVHRLECFLVVVFWDQPHHVMSVVETVTVIAIVASIMIAVKMFQL